MYNRWIGTPESVVNSFRRSGEFLRARVSVFSIQLCSEVEGRRTGLSFLTPAPAFFALLKSIHHPQRMLVQGQFQSQTFEPQRDVADLFLGPRLFVAIRAPSADLQNRSALRYFRALPVQPFFPE